jgi:hypothetical protein
LGWYWFNGADSVLWDRDANAALDAGTSGIGNINCSGRQAEKWGFALRWVCRAKQDHATNGRSIVTVQRAPSRGDASAIRQRLPDKERLSQARHPEQQSHKCAEDQRGFHQRLAGLFTRQAH